MDVTLILLLLVVGVVVAYASLQWKQIAKLKESIKGEKLLLEERRDELEKARKDARDRRDELEESKKQLSDAKNKLTKQKKEREEAQPQPQSPPKGQMRSRREEPAATPSPVIVRITDQETAAEHQRSLQRLEDELTAVRTELAAAKKNVEQHARDVERANKALQAAATAVPQAVPQAAPAPAPVVQAAPSSSVASEELAAVKAQLDAFKKVAADRERELKRETRKAQDEIKHALRRAANNQALYAVLHGQLELAEDRLAAYRVKYEGAKGIEELRREAKRDRPKRQRQERQERERNGQRDTQPPQNGDAAGEHVETTPPPIAEEMPSEASLPPATTHAAPSTIEVSRDDIVSAETMPPATTPADKSGGAN